MTQIRTEKTAASPPSRYDLESRTEQFALRVRAFVRLLPRTISNREDVSQLVRASGSVAANYIEANEALSKKDFSLRLKISRKEAKESRLFLRLVDTRSRAELDAERLALEKEATELLAILSAILRNSE